MPLYPLSGDNAEQTVPILLANRDSDIALHHLSRFIYYTDHNEFLVQIHPDIPDRLSYYSLHRSSFLVRSGTHRETLINGYSRVGHSAHTYASS
jgi:hypothetical protein